MKRFFALVICFILFLGSTTIPVAAVEHTEALAVIEPDQIILSQTIEQLGNGDYIIETISIPRIQPYSSSITGTKTSEYVSYGTTIFTISVTGTFTYDGSTATATSASGKIAAYVEGVTLNSRRAYTSGASAIATGSVTYNGATLQKTVTLTCDRNGNLS